MSEPEAIEATGSWLDPTPNPEAMDAPLRPSFQRGTRGTFHGEHFKSKMQKTRVDLLFSKNTQQNHKFCKPTCTELGTKRFCESEQLRREARGFGCQVPGAGF